MGRHGWFARAVAGRVVMLVGVLAAAALFAAVADALPRSGAPTAKHPKHKIAKHPKHKPAALPAVFVSPVGNDSTCKRRAATKPCASFGRAYGLARQGDVVQVAAGNYPGQTIKYDSSKNGSAGKCRLRYNPDGAFASSTKGCVTFEPAPGASVAVGAHTTTSGNLDVAAVTTIPVATTSGFVTGGSYSILVGQTAMHCTGSDSTDFTGCTPTPACGNPTGGSLCGYDSGTDVTQGILQVNASYLQFVGLTALGGVNATGSPTPITDDVFDKITSPASAISGRYVAFVNSTLGDNNASRQDKINKCDHCAVYDSTIAHMTNTHCDEDLAGQTSNYFCHGDGIYASGDTNLYLIGNRFYDNSVFQLYFENSFGPSSKVTIANNHFGVGARNGFAGQMSIRGQTGQTWASFTIKRNFIESGSLIGARPGASSVSLTKWLITGNIFRGTLCPSARQWSGTLDVRCVNNIRLDGHARGR